MLPAIESAARRRLVIATTEWSPWLKEMEIRCRVHSWIFYYAGFRFWRRHRWRKTTIKRLAKFYCSLFACRHLTLPWFFGASIFAAHAGSFNTRRELSRLIYCQNWIIASISIFLTFPSTSDALTGQTLNSEKPHRLQLWGDAAVHIKWQSWDK